jgi:hypothetical protein
MPASAPVVSASPPSLTTVTTQLRNAIGGEEAAQHRADGVDDVGRRIDGRPLEAKLRAPCGERAGERLTWSALTLADQHLHHAPELHGRSVGQGWLWVTWAWARLQSTNFASPPT